MKAITLQLLLIVVVPLYLLSQSTFYKSYEISNFEQVIRTHDSGFACVTGSGLLILDSETELQHYHTYGSTDADFKLITQTSDNGFIISTRNNFQDPGELAFIVKFDEQGNMIWSKRYVYPVHTTIQTLDITSAANNGFYILASGCVGSPIILRCNEDGDILWQKSSNFPYAGKIIMFSEESLIIAGINAESEFNHKVWASMIDTSGNIIWTKTYDNNRVNFLQGISKSQHNEISILITSQENSSYITNATSTVLRLSSTGVILGANTISTGENVGYHQMHGFAKTTEQGSIFTGTINMMAPGVQILFAKTDNYNNIEWARYFGNMTLNNFGTNEGIQVFESNNSFYIFSKNEDGLAIGKINENGIGFCDDKSVRLNSARSEFNTTAITLDFFNTAFSAEQIQINFSEAFPSMTVHCTDVTEVYNHSEAENVMCYPNPTSGEIFIEAHDIQQLSIYDMNGSLKKHVTAQNSSFLMVDIEDLPKGTYMFRIVANDEISVRKIIHL